TLGAVSAEKSLAAALDLPPLAEVVALAEQHLTGLHPLDGARWLARHGYPQRLADIRDRYPAGSAVAAAMTAAQTDITAAIARTQERLGRSLLALATAVLLPTTAARDLLGRCRPPAHRIGDGSRHRQEPPDPARRSPGAVTVTG